MQVWKVILVAQCFCKSIANHKTERIYYQWPSSLATKCNTWLVLHMIQLWQECTLGRCKSWTCLLVIKEMAELSSCMETSSKHLDQIIRWLVASWHCRKCLWLHGGRKDALCFLPQSILAMLHCTANVRVATRGRLCCRCSGSQQGLYKALLGLQNLLAPFQCGSSDINRRMSHFWSLPSIHGKEEFCAGAVI